MESQFAFVLLDRVVRPDIRAITEAIRSRHPDIAVSTVSSGAPFSTQAAPSMISCNGKTVAIVLVPSRLEHDDGLLARASAVWPEARPHVNGHRAHLGLWVMNGRDSPLQHARAITAVVGGLLATLPRCVGVVWDDKALYPADYWLEMSKAAFAPYPNFPSLLWFSMQEFDNGQDGQVTIVTHGLKAFAGRELELTGPATGRKLLRSRGHALAAYLMQNGPARPDQTTFQIAENEEITAHYSESKHVPGLLTIAATISAEGEQHGRDSASAITVPPGAALAEQADLHALTGQLSHHTNPIAAGLRQARTALKWLTVTGIGLILALLTLSRFLNAYVDARAHGRSVPQADLYALGSVALPISILIGVVLYRRINATRRKAQTS
jgi:hypothetical protein